MRGFRKSWFVWALVALLVPVARAQDEPLTIGDDAPAIEVSSWVKGEPIEGFQDDKVYVVEFWATWCGPCRTSIPHLTELQAQYKDQGVAIIGVSVFESDPAEVEPFVEEMGDEMVYHVAKDLIPEGGERGDGKMAQNWMQAAEEGGIPTAFVVQGGKIAWIGHPMAMDETLAQIVAGDYDIEAAAAERKEAKALEQRLAAMQQDLMSAVRAGDMDKALEVIDGAIADDPDMEQQLGFLKLNLLLQVDKPDAFVEYGTHLVEDIFADNAAALNQISWTLVDPARGDDVEESVAQVALKAAERASELAGGDDWMILDTLARAQFAAGQTQAALETQRKVVELAGEDADAEIKGRLEHYEKAADDGN